MGKTYRRLTEDEVLQLKSQSCLADDWNKVAVAEEFTTEFVHHTRFSGEVKLGVFHSDFILPGGIKKHSGLRHVTLHNVTVGDNCCIENIQNYIANYEIGNNTFIENVDIILVDGLTQFGNGVETAVLNETGGREVLINDKLSAHQAYILALYRHRPELISRMKEITDYYSNKHASAVGTIGNHVMILNTGSIKNVRIGDFCRICGTCRLYNGSINSNESAPVHIGHGVICDDFIISSGSHVDDGAMLTRCFVGQACQLGHNYSASDSLFFSNCQGENGEACAIFAGPYTVTHHKSTLLIAGMFSFMNAGSGSNQSNHMYKLGPIHQGTLERGAKTTSDSYILWPYRRLTEDEVLQLKSQSCLADDWNKVAVAEEFTTEFVHHTRFSGEVKLGVFHSDFILPGGIKKHSGLRHVTLHNVTVGDNCCIENIQNYIANYEIGNNTFIENVDIILVDGLTQFGNGVETAVLNETGGREVLINDKLSAHQAYILALYRHRPELISRMKEITDYYSNKHASAVGTIGNHVMILNTGSIKNVRIGDFCRICGTCRLYNGSINSNESAPVHIGHGVICDDFIISSGSHVDDGAMLTRCFVGQACQLGHNYSASDSLFFSNCQGENGEACAIFAGPYTVTHHKSTLLIAGMFSFMNAGSGSNQSNHMYKLGPIHQGTLERGAKTTSDSYILWPARVGAFSLVMGRHVNHADTSNLPFSYLIEQQNTTYLVPGVNLRSVGTIRDAQKWPKRDKRTDPNRLDYINYNLLSPYTIQKMFKGRSILKELKRVSGETSEIYSYQSAKIKNSSLNSGIRYYEIAIHKFLGNSIIKRLEGINFKDNEEIRRRLKPDTEIGVGEWVDIAGLIAPKSEVEKLIDGIESGEINRLKSMNACFAAMHDNYYTYEWTWAYHKIQEFYGLNPETITAKDIIAIVRAWREAVVGLDRMVYDDARKEFSLSSMTGFGADGSRDEMKLDFGQVRGDFESNPFVTAVLKHIDDKTALGEELINRIGQLA